MWKERRLIFVFQNVNKKNNEKEFEEKKYVIKKIFKTMICFYKSKYSIKLISAHGGNFPPHGSAGSPSNMSRKFQ